MLRLHRRAAEVLSQLAVQLQQTRSAKAITTKLPVVLLQARPSSPHMRARPPAQSRAARLGAHTPRGCVQDVEGVGAAGTLAKVNHGYARNFLVPNRAARPVAKAPRAGGAAAAAAAARQRLGSGDSGGSGSGSGSGAASTAAAAAAAAAPVGFALSAPLHGARV